MGDGKEADTARGSDLPPGTRQNNRLSRENVGYKGRDEGVREVRMFRSGRQSRPVQQSHGTKKEGVVESSHDEWNPTM
jgi:hypothetical protein